MERRETLRSGALLCLALLAPGIAADTCLDAPTIQLSLRNCTFSVGQADVYSWGVLLGVGNQGGQACAVPSTVVNDTLLVSADACSDRWRENSTADQCRSRKGGFINTNALPGTDIAGLEDNNPGWRALMAIDAEHTFDSAVKAPLQLRDQEITIREGVISSGRQHSESNTAPPKPRETPG